MTVTHNQTRKRFEVAMDGVLASLEYRQSNGRIVFIHTEVPESMGGKGIGSQMARTALKYAKDNQLKIEARCPFVAKYLERHPEFQ